MQGAFTHSSHSLHFQTNKHMKFYSSYREGERFFVKDKTPLFYIFLRRLFPHFPPSTCLNFCKTTLTLSLSLPFCLWSQYYSNCQATHNFLTSLPILPQYSSHNGVLFFPLLCLKPLLFSRAYLFFTMSLVPYRQMKREISYLLLHAHANIIV